MNNSKLVIADNLFRIKSMRARTLCDLANLTGIKLSTLKSWSQCKSFPSLKMLDRFCDKLRIHTSDMLEEDTQFLTPYSGPNASHRQFLINFISQCNAHHLLNDADILEFLNDHNGIIDVETDRDTISIDALHSYKRKANGRQIPIHKVDYIADQFKIKSFMLLR